MITNADLNLLAQHFNLNTVIDFWNKLTEYESKEESEDALPIPWNQMELLMEKIKNPQKAVKTLGVKNVQQAVTKKRGMLKNLRNRFRNYTIKKQVF